MDTTSRIDGTRRAETVATNRTVEERARDLVRDSRDPGFARRAETFLGSPQFRRLDGGIREQMVDALARRPTEESVDRLDHLSTDDSFLSRRADAWTDRQVRDTVLGAVGSAEPLVEASGAERRHGEGPSPLAVGDGLLTIGEVGAELSGAIGAASCLAAASAAVFVYEAADAVREAHLEGARDARRTNYGIAFAQELTAATGGPPARAKDLAGWAAGARQARRVWNDLEPSQRAVLQAMSPAERQALHQTLRSLLERRTIGGE